MVEDWGGLDKQGGHYFLVIPWLSSTAARTRNLPVGVAGAVGFLLSPAETSSGCWRSLGGRTAAPSPGGIERVDSRCSRFLLARIVALVVCTNLGVLKLMLINFLSAALQQHNIRQTEQLATVRAKRALVLLGSPRNINNRPECVLDVYSTKRWYRLAQGQICNRNIY